MQSTGVLNLVIGLTGVKEKHGPTCHISLSPAYSVSFFVFPSRRRAPVRPSSRRCSSTPPQPPVPRHHRRPLHLPPARAIATARHPRRRAPSPQRIQRRPRAPPTCAARARLHRHAPPCVSAPPPRAESRSSHTTSSPRSRASTLSHAAAAATSRTQTVRGFARAAFSHRSRTTF